MKQKGFLLLAWLGLSVTLSASSYKLINGLKDFYYGHISYADIKNDGQDPVVFREGHLTPEAAVLNLPLGPGDAVQTTPERRTEIQFDNGTIVRLDVGTRLKIETILAHSLSTDRQISNLVLEKGQVYVMYKRCHSKEIFQVVTPGAAVKLDPNSVVLVRLAGERDTDVQVERGKAFLLYGGDKSHLSQKSINGKQRGIVTSEDKIELADYEAFSDFKAWNESINSHFQELHEGNYLPKPLQKLPQAVFDFAQKFGNVYGEWLWHDLYGYVWRPYLNDYRYPWGTWQPYIYGNWTGYGEELFWIPGEPWGWVPYHLGIWMWDASRGWMWLPGSIFAPAWVDWAFDSGMYCWRPYYLYDWMSGFDGLWGPFAWGASYRSYSVYGFSASGQPNPQPNPEPTQNMITSIRKDQLKKKSSPSLPMPKEMKKAFGETLAALKREDRAVLSSIEGLSRYSVFVKKSDFLSPRWQEKVVPFDRLAKEVKAALGATKQASSSQSADISRDALLTIKRSRTAADFRAWADPGTKTSREAAPSALRDIEFTRGQEAFRQEASGSASFRFRDWNPDIRTAIRIGVEISYSSRTNEVACPQLGLSSRQIDRFAQTMGRSGGFLLSGDASSSSEPGSTRSSGSHPSAPSQSQSKSSGSSGSTKEKN
jgi:Family of unknown function (DUF6600)/FecR protein